MTTPAVPVYHISTGLPCARLGRSPAGGYATLRYVRHGGWKTWTAPRRGFGLLDVALSIGVGALSIAGFLQFEADTSNKLKASGAADFMTQVSAAATTYLQTNYTTLQQNLSGGGQAVVPVSGASTIFGLPSLQAAGLLPSNFNNVNGYGQSAVLIVRDVPAAGNTPEHIEGLVSTYGGTKMADRTLGVAVSKMGGMGGAVFNRPVPGTPAATVSGSGGSWSSPISNWSANAAYAPSAGHLAANIQQQSAMSAPWLNRYNTGNPDDNRMHTDIDDNNNNLNNVNNTDTKTLSNSRGSSVGVNSQLIIQNGGEACAGNQIGCSWMISDDGGFYDQNDGWITFKGNYAGQGLKLDGTGKNLQVGGTTESIGQIYADQGVTLYGDSPVLWGSHGGGLRMQDNQWLQAYGGDGFQGISTNIVKAAMLQDANDPSYYVQPSQTSYMNQLVMNNGTAQYFSVTQLLGAQNIAFAHSLFSVYPNTSDLSVNIDGQTGNAQFGGYVTVGGNLADWSNTSPIVLQPNGDSKFGGTMTIGQQINLPATATADAACSPNGAIAGNSNGSGQTMGCYNGAWHAVGAEAVETTYTLPDAPGGPYTGDESAMDLGEHFYCALSGTFEMNNSDPNSQPNATRVLPSDPDPRTGLRTWYLSRGNLGGLGGSASCIDFK